SPRVGQGVANSSGVYTVAVGPGALADGQYAITAVQTDLAGNVSLPSAAMNPPLTIDTTVGLPSVGLAPGSDSGLSSADHITNVTTPTFQGSAEANAQVTIIIRTPGGTEVQRFTAVATAAGTYSAATPKPLP